MNLDSAFISILLSTCVIAVTHKGLIVYFLQFRVSCYFEVTLWKGKDELGLLLRIKFYIFILIISPKPFYYENVHNYRTFERMKIPCPSPVSSVNVLCVGGLQHGHRPSLINT